MELFFFSNGWRVLRVRGGAPFIPHQGEYEPWHQLQEGEAVVLSFDAKMEHKKLTCGTGWPRGEVGRPHMSASDAPSWRES